MSRIIFHKLKIVLISIIVLGIYSCAKDDDLGNLDDTIYVRHKNADMPAYIHGNGSEKVFLITLHGGPGGMGLGFRGSAFNSIENTCAVVYFDQRGSGMSQGSYSEDDVSIDIMAEDVLALVKVIRKKYGSEARFFLLGHSWGGTLGTTTLLKNQNEFLGWIQVDGTHNPKDLYTEYLVNFEQVAAEQIGLGNSIPFWESVQQLIVDVEPEFNRDDIIKLNRQAFQAEQKLNDDGIISNSSGGTNQLFFNYNHITRVWNTIRIQSLLDPDIQGIITYTNRLSEINIPSLILWGKHDMVIPPAIAQEAYDNLGSTIKKLKFFERSGHSPMFTEADGFAEEVNLFISQNK